MFLVSIIIPHKNIPHLLQRCIDSIPSREDIQIIIVDDNSNPEIVDFKKFPGSEKKNIEVYFTKEGKGAGYARNIGLKHAKGKYILFADADDFFNYCINNILDKYKTTDTDIIFFKGSSVNGETFIPANRTYHLNSWIDLSDTNREKAILMLRYKFGEPWCKFVRKKIIEDNAISFDETSIHNDTTFSYLIGHHAKNFIIDKHAIYCVTTRNNSVSVSTSEKKYLERIWVFGRSNLFFQNNNIPLKEDRQFHQLYQLQKTNKGTYQLGKQILSELGYEDSNIKKTYRYYI